MRSLNSTYVLLFINMLTGEREKIVNKKRDKRGGEETGDNERDRDREIDIYKESR